MAALKIIHQKDLVYYEYELNKSVTLLSFSIVEMIKNLKKHYGIDYTMYLFENTNLN